MTARTRSIREEDGRVFPTEVAPVALAGSSLDDPHHRGAALARGPSAGAGLGLDRRHHRRRSAGADRSVVATHSPRGLVRGGRR